MEMGTYNGGQKTSRDIDKTESHVSLPEAVPSSPKSTFLYVHLASILEWKKQGPPLPPPPPLTPRFNSLLNPTFGWGRLMLSETSMRSILRHVHAFPTFLKHLTAFGEKGFAQDEGFAAYDIQEHFNAFDKRQGLETCFLWKYIQHDDGTAQYPWTIRQALVYQNFSCITQTSTNILIRAPLQVTNRLKHNFNTSAESRASTVAEWLGVQKVCISCGTGEWRQALNYYDEQITKLFDELVMFSIETETAGDSKKVQQCISSMKELTHLVDQLLRISHVLGLNSRIIHSMMDAARRYESAERRDAFLLLAETVQLQYDVLRQLTESLLARGNNLSRQVGGRSQSHLLWIYR
ncbi:uncharacterized protein A1O5_05409 [Cladophialophora psammophila CBS 110553]|uniref:CorA-like transporter domain-containing protein n=1 Tax=Cladophialophora psammophila CBS 110553 TaxID=1182543 RepID=W9X3U0_9EURO|nr:uncharacterized protein A1O5_05409 [Cladophialophora psammophila CBS 110553]EXJ71601.1 hypothetical protein A1O5_05409 [Cladophialophora psammophila CBS 110553]